MLEVWFPARLGKPGPGGWTGGLGCVFGASGPPKTDGMGLGLSVCKTIVKSHGGRIWAQNNDGPGASFHVALPAEMKLGGVAAVASAQLDRN